MVLRLFLFAFRTHASVQTINHVNFDDSICVFALLDFNVPRDLLALASVQSNLIRRQFCQLENVALDEVAEWCVTNCFCAKLRIN